MLLKRFLSCGSIPNHRYFCTAISDIKDSVIIQRTTYKTDDWTNIKPRFQPFIGVNLYQQKNHPLRLTHEQIEIFFRNWFKKNSNVELSVLKGTDPVEKNTLTNQNPDAFYINRESVLRTNSYNREIKLLESGLDNFLLIADLYRRCEMDSKHFPVFHRVNIVRTMNCEELTSELKQHLENEQKSTLLELLKQLSGIDLNYRWVDTNWNFTNPSWVLEINHQNEWHRVCGTGLIRSDVFEAAERSKIAGWEMGIGLERLTMFLFNIFDIRLFWNADKAYLSQFAPKVIKSQITKSNSKEDKSVTILKTDDAIDRKEFVQKTDKLQMQISYILPDDIELESFPLDELCNFIKDQIGGVVDKVTNILLKNLAVIH